MSENIGGIQVDVTLDDSKVDPALRKVQQSAKSTADMFNHVGEVGVKSADGVTKFGSSLLVVGQFADDVQYGLRAVVNQIPQLVGAFGGGAGLAGAIAIVAVGLNQLNAHWDQLVSKFTSRGPETAAQEMKRLGDNTSKTADEQKRLNDLKREEQQIESQKRRPTAESDRENKRGGEAVRESPYDLLLRDVGSALMDRDRGRIERRVQERQSQIEALTPGRKLTDEAVDALRVKYRHENAPRVVAEAEKLIKDAEFGSTADTQEQRDLDAASARSKLQALSTKYPGLKGLSKFSGQLESDKEVKDLMYESEQNYKANEERLRRERTGESRPDLEGAFQRGLAEKAADDARKAALNSKDVEQEGLDRVKAHAEAVEQERERKREQAEGIDDVSGSQQRIDERLRDNRYNIFKAMNPNQESRRMGLDQYDASVGGMTGETIADKRLQTLIKLQEENNKLLRDRAAIGAVRRRR